MLSALPIFALISLAFFVFHQKEVASSSSHLSQPTRRGQESAGSFSSAGGDADLRLMSYSPQSPLLFSVGGLLNGFQQSQNAVYVDPSSWSTVRFKRYKYMSGSRNGKLFDMESSTFTVPKTGVWQLTLRLRMTGDKGEKTCFAIAVINPSTLERTKIAEDCVACEKVYSKMLSTVTMLAEGQEVRPVFFGTISSQLVDGDMDQNDVRDTEFFGNLLAGF